MKLASDLNAGVRALEAVRIAIESGPYEEKQFVDALFCIEDYLANLQKELAQEVDARCQRKEGGGTMPGAAMIALLLGLTPGGGGAGRGVLRGQGGRGPADRRRSENYIQVND